MFTCSSYEEKALFEVHERHAESSRRTRRNTIVYDVPGTKLPISIDGIGAANTQGAVYVLLYGQY
jgi:hypothetical protein